MTNSGLPAVTPRESPLTPAPLLDPLGKLPPLPPDVDEAGARLEYLERVADVVALDLTVGVGEALGALALNLARPYAPLDGPQRRRPQHQAQGQYEQRNHRLDGDVEREGLHGRCRGSRG